jgi:hypothetical protein
MVTKRIFALGLFFALTSVSHAQWLKENPFRISSITNDSQITIQTDRDLKPDVRLVWISVKKGPKQEDTFIEANERHINTKVWLRFGPGQYQVSVMTNNTTIRTSNYTVQERVQVENMDSRENIDVTVPSAQIQSDDAGIVDLAESLTQGMASDMDKTEAIHEWMTHNIAYDVENFFAGTYIDLKWDAVTMLEKKKAICAGYANLAAALNRAVGIPSRVVLGEAILRGGAWTGATNHAWNEMLIDGRWVIQDSTWDAGSVDFTRKTFTFMPRKKYFDPDPAVFALDHRAESK